MQATHVPIAVSLEVLKVCSFAGTNTDGGKWKRNLRGNRSIIQIDFNKFSKYTILLQIEN